ncbi:MAG: glycerophosphoryl diester phosphodiesterase membrane domain-containing protein [Merdibacter sp.]
MGHPGASVILFFALLFIVFELLTLYAMTWCMLHKRGIRPPPSMRPFHQLKVLRHPSSLLAPIYFMGLLPLTHIGYVSSYLTTVQIPAFITSELSLTLPGKLLVLLFFGAIFLLYALLSFAIPLLFQETASFWSACRDSVRSIMQMPRRQKWIFALVVLGCFLLHAFFLRQLPAPV